MHWMRSVLSTYMRSFLCHKINYVIPIVRLHTSQYTRSDISTFNTYLFRSILQSPNHRPKPENASSKPPFPLDESRDIVLVIGDLKQKVFVSSHALVRASPQWGTIPSAASSSSRQRKVEGSLAPRRYF